MFSPFVKLLTSYGSNAKLDKKLTFLLSLNITHIFSWACQAISHIEYKKCQITHISGLTAEDVPLKLVAKDVPFNSVQACFKNK